MRNKKLIILFSVLLSITLLVVVSSVLFSVQHVNAYCLNVEEQASKNSDVEEVANQYIKRGSSIFFVNKNKVSAEIEEKVKVDGVSVRVLNIEKVFPNRIYINYVEVKPYLKVTAGTTTYLLGNNMKVMQVLPNDLGDGCDAIRLQYTGTLPELKVGDTLSFETPRGLSAADVVTEIFGGLEKLGYYDGVVNMFDTIDLRGNFVELTTRYFVSPTASEKGMIWQIVTPDNMADKLRLAYSVYISDKLSDAQKRTGTLVIAGNKASYRGGSGGVVPIE